MLVQRFGDFDRSGRGVPRVRAARAAAAVLAALLAVPASGAERGRAAPELPEKDPSAWINSRPITLESLRGQVVLIEIWTFG